LFNNGASYLCVVAEFFLNFLLNSPDFIFWFVIFVSAWFGLVSITLILN